MITSAILSTSLASVPIRALAQNATANDKHVGWVSAESGRSTSDILWSCFSILLVCTYKCFHFNVPSQEESEAGRFTRAWWWKLLKKLGWMTLNVLAPEIGIAIAMDQYLLAREQCHEENSGKSQGKRKVVEGGEKDVEMATTEINVDKRGEQDITNTHTLFANMGGFQFQLYALSSPEQEDTQRNPTSPDNVSQAEITVRAVDTVVAVDKAMIVEEVSFPLNSWEELVFCRAIFPAIRIPTEKEINDLSKADAFTKAFACIQSSWLIIQSIVRVSVGIPITQLELATMAFVVCALTMYLLWWHKPFGVESRASVTVIAHKESFTSDVANILRPYHPIWPSDYRGTRELIRELRTRPEEFATDRGFSPELVALFRVLRLPNVDLDQDERPELVALRRVLVLQKINFARVKLENEKHNRKIYKADLTWQRFLDLFMRDARKFSKLILIEFRKVLWIVVQNVFGNAEFAKPPRRQTRTLAFYATGTMFSALHIAAWNWEFPSYTARWLWRVLAIAATGTGPVTILLVFTARALDGLNINTPDSVERFFLALLVLIYAASRIGLVVLIFFCFSSMPVGVYETVNWLQFLPRFS
ncbi:hypothetical protein F5882DRAFT_444439 [Hyaloscypha sp. PMI_1271]|nr:hypothetical protein F5882DRAFT_444439 [Hyaloscypha sp. PMI_1271]